MRMSRTAAKWKQRVREKEVARTIGILREKFEDTDSFRLLFSSSVSDDENSSLPYSSPRKSGRFYMAKWQPFLTLVPGKEFATTCVACCLC